MTDWTGGVPECIEVEVCGRRWALERTGDLERLWESIGMEDFGDDERLPYWAEVWPATLILGQWLTENRERIAGRTCLDLGCGLGLSALVAGALGARVLGLDYEWPAVFFSRRNAALNGVAAPVRPLWVQMDWRAPALKPGALAFVWAGDILYERRFVGPVAAFLEYALAPEGKVWLAGPERNTQEPFATQMQGLGWTCSLLRTQTAGACASQQAGMTIHLWELGRGPFARRAAGRRTGGC